MSCHQAGGPIFPRIPWSEADNTPANQSKVFQSMKALNPLTREGGAALFSYDRVVRQAADRIRLRKICEEYCQDDACKTRLLAAALRASIENVAELRGISPSRSSQELADIILSSKEEQAFMPDQKAIFKNGYATPSSVLPDRDPLANGAPGGLTTVILGNNPKPGPNTEFAKNTQPFEYREDTTLVDTDGLISAKTKKIVGIKGEADPATPRPKVTNFFPGMSTLDQSQLFLGGISGACFGLSFTTQNADLLDAELIQKLQGADLTDYIKTSPNFDQLMKQWPPQKDLMLATLKGEKWTSTEVAKSAIAADCAQSVANDILNNAPKNTLFTKYCSECHAGMAAEVTGYELPLTDLGVLKKYGQGKVLQYLKNKKMPASDASSFPSNEERALMIKMLEDIK